MIKININTVKSTSFGVLTLPVLLFFLGWLKLIIALPLCLSILFALFLIIRGYSKQKPMQEEERYLEISYKGFIFIISVILVWCFLAGQGGFFYQSSDHNWRNAAFRDLINMKWPVIYDFSDSALVYYITYWLVPAGIGKIFGFFGGTDVAWLAGNVSLYVWSCLFLFLAFLLLMITVKVHSFKKIVFVMLLFVLFSGLDIIGILLLRPTERHSHIEWWSRIYQYSSNTTQLFWVFNQSNPAWLGILLLLNERNVKNFAFLAIITLAFSPFPAIGLLPFLIALAIKFGVDSYKNKKLGRFFGQIFSFQNIVATLFILPIFYLYYSINDSASTHKFRLYLGIEKLGLPGALLQYVLFCMLEFGIYALLLFKLNKRNMLYWVSVLSLVLVGVCRMGGGADFSMRGSIPALMVLMVLVIQYLLKENLSVAHLKKPFRQMRKRTLALVIALAIGVATPSVEYLRGFHNVISHHKINLVADKFKTFSDKPVSKQFLNFFGSEYQESLFFKYLAK